MAATHINKAFAKRTHTTFYHVKHLYIKELKSSNPQSRFKVFCIRMFPARGTVRSTLQPFFPQILERSLIPRRTNPDKTAMPGGYFLSRASVKLVDVSMSLLL
jgi:hypothetical protein